MLLSLNDYAVGTEVPLHQGSSTSSCRNEPVTWKDVVVIGGSFPLKD